MFSRGTLVNVSGYGTQLGRVYRVDPTEIVVAMFSRQDLWADGSPRFYFGTRHVVVKANRLTPCE